MSVQDWDDEDDYEPYDPYLDDPDHYREQDGPDDDWDDDDDPDEPDWGYEAGRAEYEEHCIRVHGGLECDCRPSLRERLRRAAEDLQRWARNLRRRARRDWDEPPF